MTIIQQPFSPWHVKDGLLQRASHPYAIWVGLNSYEVYEEVEGNSRVIAHSLSLGDAVKYADHYIERNFETGKTTEQKLDEALAEIESLKARIDELERPKPKFELGQSVELVAPSRHVNGARAITKREYRNSTWLYSRDASTPWLRENELVAAQ